MGEPMFQFKDRGRLKRFIAMSSIFMLFMLSNSHADVNKFDLAVNHPPIPILDEQGVNVLESNQPYSPKKSCAGSGCHDYDKITHAYHFEMGRDEADDNYGATRGLPHLVSPGYYGGYSCMSGDNPQVLSKKNNASINDFADYGSAGHVKTCMSCHTGGGWAEKDREGIRYDEKKLSDIKFGDGDYYEREILEDGTEQFALWDWKKSGVGEADCMYCHIDFDTLKLPADSGLAKKPSARNSRTNFAKKGYFREAATGLMEMVLNDSGKNLVTVKRKEIEERGKTKVVLDLDANEKPQFTWHVDAFDADGRTVIPMLRFPGNKNCMECHRTSNGRRGFYGFGEVATANISQEDADAVLEDDYQDDVHKGKTYIDNNGQSRDIETCNACHSKQYFKSNLASIDLDANHDFPKGNSDMDVRNDLDYAPNAKSCEECHINSNNPIVPSGHETLLKAHLELWKGNGDMAGYSRESLTKITQVHFDVVSCQACHITGKKRKSNGKIIDIPVMYRYRVAEDGKSKIVPYKPSLRALWKDQTSGRVLAKKEKASIYKAVKDADGEVTTANIVDLISGDILGTVSAKKGRHGVSYGNPATYEEFMALKIAYDSLLRKKGVVNPNTAFVVSEANEYIISHNTRPSPDSVPCGDCHARKQSGAFSSLVSPAGIFGSANERSANTRMPIPDARLVADGIVILDLRYTTVKPNGDLVQNVSDILFETKIDPFMSLLKNSSAKETVGEFSRMDTDSLLALVGSPLDALMGPDLPSQDSFMFVGTKGAATLRTMAAAIDGNTVNSILFPTFRGKLGLIQGIEVATQQLLTERAYGRLRSDVFYFDVLDAAKNHVTSFNGAAMFIKAAYKGTNTDVNQINVIVADINARRINQLPRSSILVVQPMVEGEEGYVIFKITEPGFFLVADK